MNLKYIEIDNSNIDKYVFIYIFFVLKTIVLYHFSVKINKAIDQVIFNYYDK